MTVSEFLNADIHNTELRFFLRRKQDNERHGRIDSPLRLLLGRQSPAKHKRLFYFGTEAFILHNHITDDLRIAGGRSNARRIDKVN